MEWPSVGSEAVAEIFWITYSSSTRLTCAVSSRTISVTTTLIARTMVLRRIRLRRGRLCSNQRSQHDWCPSRGWAGCIIDTTGSRLPEEIVQFWLDVCHRVPEQRSDLGTA